MSGAEEIAKMTIPLRPKRLWGITIMNVLVALIGIGAVAFVLTSTKVPAELVPGKWSATFSILIPTTLISSSVLAFFRFRWARWVALISAVGYFGIILVHNLLIFLDPQGMIGQSISERDSHKLLAAVIRSSLEIGLNVWAYLSAKSGAYFRA
jgi:hypothetical protein